VTATLHRCFRAAHCLRWEKHPNGTARLGAAIYAEAGLCDACTRHLGYVLDDLPRTYVELNEALARVRRPGQDVVAGTRELPIPIRGDVEALMGELVHEAHCWAESTAERIGIYLDTQVFRDARPGKVLQRCARLLADAVSVLLALRDVDHVGWVYDCSTEVTRDGLDGAAVLLDLHHRARVLLGRTRLINRLPAPCPRCEYLALERHDGSETITCAHCARHYTWDEYWNLCTVLSDRREIPA
jgi:hypothetical protein